MNDGDIEKQIIRACDKYIKKYVEILKYELHINQIPEKNIPYTVMEPSGKSSHSGVNYTLNEPDISSFFRIVEPMIQASTEWVEAKELILTYIQQKKIESLDIVMDIQYSFLNPLLYSYFNEIKSVNYDELHSLKVCSSLISHLKLPGIIYYGLILLNNFYAEKSFKLDDDTVIRPINQKDYIHLIEKGHPFHLSDAEQWIYNDRWVCEVKKYNPRGTFLGQNQISEMAHSDLPLIFRMFKDGDVGIKLGSLSPLSVYENRGQHRGTRFEHIALGKHKYQLSVREINQLTKFWKEYELNFKKDGHYLQVPLRRLRRSGTRDEKEDSLIDCVIGLESLLGTSDEKTEIGYRFRIRGAVLLAKTKAERPLYVNKLKNLYNLRSAITHGDHVATTEFNEYLAFAEESLRSIWKWFFEYFPNASSNREGINKIDTELVIK